MMEKQNEATEITETTQTEAVEVEWMVSESGTLKAGEPHPMAQDAIKYVFSLGLDELFKIREAMASCAIEGNRMAEICGETLRRVIVKEPVSDRYLLGLAWYLRSTR